MKGKPLEMSLLFDFYGDALTEKQRAVFELYYHDDLSLSEIASFAGITRQGVRDSIKRAEHTLEQMEQRLGLVGRYHMIQQCSTALACETERLRSRNHTALHDPIVGEITEHLENIVRRLRQEVSDGI